MASAALLLAAGCAPDSLASAPHRGDVSAAGMVTPGVVSAVPSAPEREPSTEELVARTLRHVAALRELEPTGTVKSRVLSRAELFTAVSARLKADLPHQVALGTEELLRLLGVVPLEFDYEASVLQLLGTQLAGFYDPDDETLYLAGDLGEGESRVALVHELVHALQDQHFDLGTHVKYREGASDAQSAVHALAEGDATSAMTDWIMERRGVRATDLSDAELSAAMIRSMNEAEGVADVPGILKRAVLAPYVDGLAMVHWARRRWGWAGVDRAWRALPQSTEQVLHPEKLLAQEPPVAVAVAAAPSGGGYRVAYQDVLGEQTVRLVLEEWLEAQDARAAASGWGGDRVAVFCEAQRCALGWRIRYDDVTAARRGLVAFAAGVLWAKRHERESASEPNQGAKDSAEEAGGWRGGAAVRVSDAELAIRGGQICQERSQRGPIAVAGAGPFVVVVAGPCFRGAAQAGGKAGCGQALRWAAQLAREP